MGFFPSFLVLLLTNVMTSPLPRPSLPIEAIIASGILVNLVDGGVGHPSKISFPYTAPNVAAAVHYARNTVHDADFTSDVTTSTLEVPFRHLRLCIGASSDPFVHLRSQGPRIWPEMIDSPTALRTRPAPKMRIGLPCSFSVFFFFLFRFIRTLTRLAKPAKGSAEPPDSTRAFNGPAWPLSPVFRPSL
ncbi:hypothetical protein BDP55DRAFT_230346 [Colletotrichum godetiae]|uniref:Uncharacterized protein n=1 Tax=Colletotrichum godetiae TaxID=1209918 RepID=A0AAJ0ET72_9PEZI|nr:uncharacterized protein BDP55DRAFT_230346 [Colletotrichum godetiae]KAK1673043.1 hypothetical protein BDP55DRAFT_230346 [Colletotrichum godetiae]